MKRRTIRIIGLLLIGCLISIKAAESTNDGGVNFFKQSAQRHASGQLERCKLSSPQLVQGYHCKRWLWFHESGQIKQLQLAQATKIKDIEFPEDTTVFFDPAGRLVRVYLATDLKIGSLPIRGGAKISTAFQTNGLVASCFLSKPTTIQGIPCKASLFHPIFLHPNGRLKKATLSESIVYKNVRLEQGTTVFFDPNGILIPAQ